MAMGRGPACAIRAGAMLLLGATPVAAQEVGVVAGRVVAAEGEAPLAGVEVAAAETRARAFTDREGRYVLRLPAGAHELRATLVGWLPARRTVVVAAGAAVEAEFRLAPAVVPIDALVVVGTRGGERAVAASPAPVDVFGVDDIEATGLLDASRVLERLVPSFVAGAPWPEPGAAAAPGASLRGVAGDRIVLLVDGRRRTGARAAAGPGAGAGVYAGAGPGLPGRPTASELLDAIPAGAIERIEVLRSGATALYGPGAAAGAINVVLRRGSGGEAWSHVGERFDGGEAVVGGGASYGAGLGARGRLFVAAELRDRTLPGEPGGGGNGFRGDGLAGDGRPWGEQMGSALLDASLAIGGVEVFATGAFAARRAAAAPDAGGAPAAPVDPAPDPAPPTASVPAPPTASVPATALAPVTALDPATASDPPADTAAGAPPGWVAADVWDAWGTVGARGAAAGWSWEVGADFGVRDVGVEPAGAAAPAGAASGTSTRAPGVWHYRWATFGAEARRRVARVAPWPVQVALGVVVRAEGVDAAAPMVMETGTATGMDAGKATGMGPRGATGMGARAATGTGSEEGAGALMGTSGGASKGALRGTSQGVYVTGEAGSTGRWGVTVGARVEGYGGAGVAPAGGVAVRVAATPWLGVRGWAGVGFRAVDGGGEALGLERSREAGAGVVLTRGRDLMVTLDGYGIMVGGAAVASRVPGGGAWWVANTVDTRTLGVDLAVAGGLRLGG
ncbi:MAG TPA: TonB-dependent receptor plug domain-containing protein, partial [Longimicrobiales bacterium]